MSTQSSGKAAVGASRVAPCAKGGVDAAVVVRSFLRQSAVSEAIVERLAASATIREHVSGHRIWGAGQTATAMTIIARGMVKIGRRLPNGESVTMGIFGPRDAVGLLAALDGVAYPADAVALSKRVVIVSVPVGVLQAALAADGSLARSLMGRMAGQARQLHEKIQIVSSGSVQARLAHLLLRLADRYGDELESGETCIPIDLTRKTMAEFIEARVETVIRAMSAWQRAGVLRSTADGIVIRRVAALREAAELG